MDSSHQTHRVRHLLAFGFFPLRILLLSDLRVSVINDTGGASRLACRTRRGEGNPPSTWHNQPLLNIPSFQCQE